MKKKSIITIIIVFIVVIIGLIVVRCVIVLNNSPLYVSGHRPKQISLDGNKKSLPDDDSILIKYYFSNYAWSKIDYGEYILKNGDKYLYNCAGIEESGCVIKKNGSIRKNDLKLIKNYGSKLNNSDVSIKNTANDYGELSIVYYKNSESVALVGRGDNKIDNKNMYSKKILNILRKYNIYV